MTRLMWQIEEYQPAACSLTLDMQCYVPGLDDAGRCAVDRTIKRGGAICLMIPPENHADAA